jgi:glycosyltransferase involved in cell wall biosynthesis
VAAGLGAWLRQGVQRVLGPATVPSAVSIGELAVSQPSIRAAWRAYKLRWKRLRLLARAFRKRGQVRSIVDRTDRIRPGAILAFVTVRNESVRLPHFLAHHRKLGVDHFLVVDNDSDDGSRDLLAAQKDVSLWGTEHGYKQSRFGLDWLTWLQRRHGHGHWCLTLDADEILIYPYCETRNLRALTGELEAQGLRTFGAVMLDMYPKGPLAAQHYAPGQDPIEVMPWFDSGNYVVQVQPLMRNLWIQGGARARSFFGADPRRAPTLNKVPLVRWDRRFAYVNSTHAILPRRLNAVFSETGGERISGVLLHTKFLPIIVAKSAEEQQRQQHFANSALYDDYYLSLIQSPDLWSAQSRRYTGWRQLEAMGLMSRGGWI